MTAAGALLVAGSGLIAGGVNAVAGGGTLLSFPVLVGTGLSPLAANVTNTVGLVPGIAAGGAGYRAELRGHERHARAIALDALLGSLIGVTALLLTPAHTFSVVIPWFVGLACVVLLAQRRLGALVARRPLDGRNGLPGALHPAVVLAAAYGSYFGAALGVMTLALLGLLFSNDYHELNALKITVTFTANLIAAVGFALFGPVHWGEAGILAVGTILGGIIGSLLARRVNGDRLRIAVGLIGIGVAVWLGVR